MSKACCEMMHNRWTSQHFDASSATHDGIVPAASLISAIAQELLRIRGGKLTEHLSHARRLLEQALGNVEQSDHTMPERTLAEVPTLRAAVQGSGRLGRGWPGSSKRRWVPRPERGRDGSNSGRGWTFESILPWGGAPIPGCSQSEPFEMRRITDKTNDLYSGCRLRPQ